MNIKLYSTGCPRCHVLESKLNSKNISYEVCSDKDTMISMGLTAVPVLEVDGKRMEFKQAVEWINKENEE